MFSSEDKISVMIYSKQIKNKYAIKIKLPKYINNLQINI